MPAPPDWALVLAVGSAAIGLGLGLAYAALPRLVRPAMRAMLAPRYAIRPRGLEHVPRSGPALIAVNHVTWIDGFVLAAACPRRLHCLINAAYVDFPIVRQLARRVGLIPVPTAGPRGQRAAIAAAREALDRGLVVVIFPEAQLTRTGLVGPFFRGLEMILDGRGHVPVIPTYLDNLWGSVFSHSGGRFFRKWPRGLRRTVNLAFGPPVPPPVDTFAVRQAVLAAGVVAAGMRPDPPRFLETISPDLPRWDHPEFGLLAASALDFDLGGIRQVGQKPGTVGHPIPGVALRAIDDDGRTLPAGTSGRLQVLLPGREGWAETGRGGSLDRDGFVTVSEASP